VPFALYHYITLMNTAWLLLISYMFVFYSRYWGIIATFLTVLAFQGLREIANVLAEPLGNDKTDIPVRKRTGESVFSRAKASFFVHWIRWMQ
jgi:predicted membrane chloride channel (bestrophin family)